MTTTTNVPFFSVEEVTEGIMPANADWRYERYNTETLSAQAQRPANEEIVYGGNAAGTTYERKTMTGSITANLAIGAHDHFFEAAMGNAYGAGATIDLGLTKKTFSICRGLPDLGRWLVFHGCFCTGFRLGGQWPSKPTVQFDFVSTGFSIMTSSPEGTGSIAAIDYTKTFLNMSNNMSDITIDGVDHKVRSANLSLTRTAIPNEESGADAPTGHDYGQPTVTVEVGMYARQGGIDLTDASFANVAIPISYQHLISATEFLGVSMPAATYTVDNQGKQGQDTKPMQQFTFTGGPGAANASALVLSKYV